MKDPGSIQYSIRMKTFYTSVIAKHWKQPPCPSTGEYFNTKRDAISLEIR